VIAFSFILALATLLVGLGLALLASRMPRLWAQVATLALAAIALPLGSVMVGGALMLNSGHDITVLATLIAAGLAALVGVWLIGRRLLAPVKALQRTTARISSGDLSARTTESGPREMQELGAAFNAMAEHLEELQDARTQLVAWASHDLRAPLANLQAMLEAVEDGVAPAERYLPAMGEQVHALGDLVDDLFELARLDAGSLTLELRNVRVTSLVESCVRGVEADAQARGVSIMSAVSPELPEVLCAPDKVERVLYNLVTNALRHTPNDGTVALRVKSEDDHVLVSVEDTGDGLSHEALSRMFDHFWRGDRARVRDGAGAGLGLAIARGLIEAHGGDIWAENRSEGGARISFTLPAVAV
jgi:signal transduction histidine kinase